MRSPPNFPRPVGHVFVAGGTIGLLAMALSAGLNFLGIIDRVNGWVSRFMAQGNDPGMQHSLPLWVQGLAVMGVAFAISWTLLGVPEVWRQLIFWISALVVILGWIPVLWLAAYSPEVAAPLIAAVWSGGCAIVYARNHVMPCEVTQPESVDETR